MSGTDGETDARRDPGELEETLAYRFADRRLLETALCHASFAHETEGVRSNERLEFLGDAVLGLVVAHALHEAHPQWSEGDLTRALQNRVDARSLARLGSQWDVGAYLQLGRTERQSGGNSKPGILSDAVEAVLGAMYLDGGLACVETLLRREFAEALQSGAQPIERDPKTRLQEWVMARSGAFPVYECLVDTDVEGDEQRFTVEVRVGDERWGEGVGRSKRIAQRRAAESALERVDREAQA